MIRHPWLCTLFVSLAGCVIGGDKYARPRDLTDAWMVDKTRVLGIRAIPAEARPGDLVSFQMLLAAPPDDEEDRAIVWLACGEDDAAGGFGCALDLGEIDFDNADPAALAEIGFIGFEPGLPPLYAVPDDILDDVTDERELQEGMQVTVQSTAFPVSVLEDDIEELDFNVVEAAYKRLPVSLANTPNANPQLAAFTVDAISVPSETVVYVDPEQNYDLAILLPDGARQLYEFLNEAGEVEERVEEPYAAWFTTGGTLLESVTLWPFMEATWTAPSEADVQGTWYAVVRDRRGGMTWWVQPWTTAPPR